MSQARYWMLTIPYADFVVPEEVPTSLQYLRGQRELGEGGFDHWQLLAHFKKPARLAAVKKVFGRTCHAEVSRSEAADAYVWKLDTRVEGTNFELGARAIRRSVATDWDAVASNARSGRLDLIPSDVLVRCYNQLRRIEGDALAPTPMEREVRVYWGATGTGKSRTAWAEAGWDAYPKGPRSRFWDGYRGSPHVIIDEFRGAIDVAYLLTWFDRYPVVVEVKGSSVVLKATKIWLTSNLHPRDWYPDLDAATVAALLRRLTITEFPEVFKK